MKKISHLLLIFLGSFSIQSFASIVIDTTTAVYDFNNLTIGNLNGKDNWITTKHSTTGDFQVTGGAGYDLTNALTFGLSGSGVGVDASRSFASLFSNTVFSNTSSKYIITFDVYRSYWGFQFAIGADINNDGKITNSDVTEKAIIFSTSAQAGEKLTLPTGAVTSYPTALTNAWTTIEITLSNFNSGSGNITVKSKVLGTSVWNTIANNLALGADTNTIDKKNPKLWKMVFAHCEGATGKLDNISITRIGPSIVTSVAENKMDQGIQIYPNPVNDYIHLISKEVNSNTFFVLMDLTGREVERVKVESSSQLISLSKVNPGIHFYKVMNENELFQSGKLIVK